MKILNLYAGIGGNRKFWGNEHEITAVEYNESIASIYKDLYQNDTVIVADAHEYLRLNFMDYDFIWSSPPCQTHSRLNFSGRSRGEEYQFPSMKLYEEIILLDTFFKGKYVIENVTPYYTPLIPPQISGRHCFWANFKIPNINIGSKVNNDKGNTLAKKMKDRGFEIINFHNYDGDKRQLLNNCVEPEIGQIILNRVLGIEEKSNVKQTQLF